MAFQESKNWPHTIRNCSFMAWIFVGAGWNWEERGRKGDSICLTRPKDQVDSWWNYNGPWACYFILSLFLSLTIPRCAIIYVPTRTQILPIIQGDSRHSPFCIWYAGYYHFTGFVFGMQRSPKASAKYWTPCNTGHGHDKSLQKVTTTRN